MEKFDIAWLFFQLEGRCSNCNHFFQPYKAEWGVQVQVANYFIK